MNDAQWHTLLAVIRGENVMPVPVAFIMIARGCRTGPG
jgi:hypothetical protein